MSLPPSTRSITGDSPSLPSFVEVAINIPITRGVPSVNLDINQVAGLIPAYPCESDECREQCEPCGEYKNPVFGKAGVNEATYENDFSTFYFDFPLVKNNYPSVSVAFIIEKYVAGQWITSINFTDNTYGFLYDFGTIQGHPTYKGLAINWGKVLALRGAGCYRLKINMSFTTISWGGNYTSDVDVRIPVIYTACKVTPVFELNEFDCDKAHGTAKFEILLTGIIGDPYKDYYKHDLCGLMLYDSLRVKGFIGFGKTPTYKTENNKWGPPKQGKIDRVRDEQIQQWEYKSGLLPEYIHTRFSTFVMMSDNCLGSDYNINNSDWTIKRKSIIKSTNATYEPTWLDLTADWLKRNKGHVSVIFNRGVQSVEKYNCCSTVTSIQS